MGESFRAILIEKPDDKQIVKEADLTVEDLMEGDTVLAVSHSTVNYKDGLSITGSAPIARRYPMIPGIDLVGTVETSENAAFSPGERVLINGFGLGETHYGGYAEKARVKSDWLVKLPEAFTPAQSMAIGTAGYTAMLCVLALEEHGLTPQSGPILVTGAAGGVGSVAVAVLAKLGFTVLAATGRAEEEAYLKGLGASEILDREELSAKPRPIGKERWAGAVDVAGGKVLANVLSQTSYGGTVAACGLAAGGDLPGSVFPFIIRGVTLAGIDSVMAPQNRRLAAWQRLARDLDVSHLEAMTAEHPLSDVMSLAPDIIAGRIRGRTVLKVS